MAVEISVGRVFRLEYESRAVAGGRHLLRCFGRHVGRAEAKGRVLSAIGRTDLFHNEEDFSGPVTFPFLDGIAIGAKDGVTLKIGMYWKEVVIQERELEKKIGKNEAFPFRIQDRVCRLSPSAELIQN